MKIKKYFFVQAVIAAFLINGGIIGMLLFFQTGSLVDIIFQMMVPNGAIVAILTTLGCVAMNDYSGEILNENFRDILEEGQFLLWSFLGYVIPSLLISWGLVSFMLWGEEGLILNLLMFFLGLLVMFGIGFIPATLISWGIYALGIKFCENLNQNSLTETEVEA